jgi:hypothetical protein
VIPIVSIADFINGIVSLVITGIVFRMYDRTRQDGIFIFGCFFLSFSIFWFVFASPGIIFFDAFSITVASVVGYVFLFLTLLCLIQIPFLFWKATPLRVILSGAIIISNFGFLIGRYINPSLDQKIINGNYIFWVESYDAFIRLLPGTMAFVVLSFCIGVFVHIYIDQQTTGRAKRVARDLVIGIGLILIGASIYFIITSGGFIASIIASVVCISGQIFMLHGVKLIQKERGASY